MSLTKLTENLNKVSSLPEKPTLSPEALQAVFDEAGNLIKSYINDTLTPEVEALINTKMQEAKVIVDNVLDSTSTTHALSSLQGNNLHTMIESLDTNKQKKITYGTDAPTGGENGDYYKKPTQYWFIGFEPKYNYIFEPIEFVETKIINSVKGKHRQRERSMIHLQYARRFIKQYLID